MFAVQCSHILYKCEPHQVHLMVNRDDYNKFTSRAILHSSMAVYSVHIYQWHCANILTPSHRPSCLVSRVFTLSSVPHFFHVHCLHVIRIRNYFPVDTFVIFHYFFFPHFSLELLNDSIFRTLTGPYNDIESLATLKFWSTKRYEKFLVCNNLQ